MDRSDAQPRRRVERQLRAIVGHMLPSVRIYFPRRRDFRVKYSWNGRHLRPTGLTLESQCHEVAHLLVSSRSRRHLAEFGLGPDPYRHSDAVRACSARLSDREELAACAMQLILVRLLGLDEGAVITEVHATPLTPESVRALRRRFPRALPAAWWRRALDSVAAPAASPPG